MTRDSGAGSLPLLLGGFLLLCAIAGLLTLSDLDRPGLYYDEVIQAEPAVRFLAGEPPPAIPGMLSVRLFGGWLPVMTQSYMGALKSQALIPVFAVFEPTAASLRVTTVVWSLIALCFAMLWAREILGNWCALAGGALMALDPSFLFIGRHDWGSFALGLLCRCAGLYLVTTGFTRRAVFRLLFGGLCFGLGAYNKVDFAVFLVAALVALVVSDRRGTFEALRARRGAMLAVLVGFGAGAALILWRFVALLARGIALFQGSIVDPAERAEKWNTIRAMLDGSYFHRLMLSGGKFERMFETDAAGSPFLVAFFAAAVVLGLLLFLDRRRGEPCRARTFVLLAAIVTLAGIWLMPRAVRIHHALNVFPFPQLVIAVVAHRLWLAGNPAAMGRRLARAAAIALIVVLVAGHLHVIGATRATLRETGGRGRWSDALARLAPELKHPETVTVSLDWGFDGPLRFTARDLKLLEPIWEMRFRGRWTHDGTPGHVYLVHDETYAVFDYGGSFLEAVRRLPSEQVEIREHRDRAGGAAFLSVRLRRPHRAVFDGKFDITLF